MARPDAAEVYPGLLIGSAPGTRQRRALVKSGVTIVVDMRDEARDEDCRWPPEVTLVRSPVVDRMAPEIGSLTALADWIAGNVSSGRNVFVHCHAGIGRSATVICAVLVSMGWSLTDAYNRLREVRPSVAPTDVQLQLLRAFEHQSRSRPAPASPPGDSDHGR